VALKNVGMVKTVYGAADLSLQALAGQSLLIRAVEVYSPNDVFATFRIEKTTVGYFLVSEGLGSHLSFPKAFGTDGSTLEPLLKRNLLSMLFDLGIFKGYPVAEGETFYITGIVNAASFKKVIYDIYDAGDKKPEDENGSKAKEYVFLNYGTVSGGVSAAGDSLFAKTLCPVEFPAFPYGDDVPARTTITLFGICGREAGVRNATPATAIYTQFLKLVKEREVLFDSDRKGFLYDFSIVTGGAGTRYAGGKSQIGNFTQIDPREPLLFIEPLVFEGGEELSVYVTVAEPVDGSTLSEDALRIALIEKVVKE